MKLFAPALLAITAAQNEVAQEEECGVLEVQKVINYRGECYFGNYPTGYQNWQTDYLALYLVDAIDRMYSNFLDSFTASNPQWSYSLTVRDMKEDYADCNFGRYCTGLNIEVDIDFIMSFTSEIPCIEGSGGEEGSGEEQFESRKRRQAIGGGFDTSGFNTEFDTSELDVSQEDFAESIEADLANNRPAELADASGQSLTFITATSETEVETTATVTDGNNVVTTVRGQWVDTGFSCDDGFELLGGICRDINECDSITCDAGFSCYNFDGGYECRDDSATECLDGFENFPECTDINECYSSPCSPNASCTNTRGSYLCACNDGYYEADGECKDVDECEPASDPCIYASCENNPGGYECSCFPDHLKTANSDECFRTASLDCFDGNNGGCSHFCATDGCTCPDCWELDADGLTCKPMRKHLHVTCAADSMTASADQCVFGMGASISMIDNACSAVVDSNDDFVYQTALDGCGMNVTSENGIISFTNRFTVSSRDGPIVMHSDPEVDFTCSYSSQIDGVSTDFAVKSETQQADGSEGSGTFEFELEFVAPDHANNFAVQEDDELVVGEIVYFDVKNLNPVDGVSFIVKDCIVSETEGDSSHAIITDNCLDSNVMVQRVGPLDQIAARETARFSYTAFVFTGNDSEETTLDLTCNVVACVDSECSDLTQACVGRKRRSADPVNAQIYQVKAQAKLVNV